MTGDLKVCDDEITRATKGRSPFDVPTPVFRTNS
jgi:hypothetical protein